MRALRKLYAGTLSADKRGVAAIEFAVIVPMLLILAVGMADMGMGMYDKMQTQNASQAGADYALIHLTAWNKAAIKTAIINASSLSGVSPSPDPYAFCGCPGTGGVTQVDCTTGTCTGQSVGCYIKTSATYTYNTILPYPKILNFLKDKYVLSSNATVRVNEAAACKNYN
ncbi:MAG TPA: TadE/TadG family type IV pilus assembly protein [Rhizomicrobium sp.]|jgi:Flp pilus assembly protein TadG|nr:TadE/TadG family type IV pilus assembly protein [Rhizomicrobium sp.]